MRKAFLSVLRILIGAVVGLGLLVLGIGLAVRQPNAGRYPFPDGPRADPAALRRHVEFLCTRTLPRNPGVPGGIEIAADYIKAGFAESGVKVTEQAYEAFDRPCRNIIARFGPVTGRVFVVGAHYDAFGVLPGADDNASGVAGLLELARLLAARDLRAPVELVAFSSEEPPYFGRPEMGSAHHSQSLRNAGAEVEAMISLEMIGFYSKRQPFTDPFLYLLYPRTGDFISIVGRWEDRALARELKRSFRGATTVPAVSYSGPVGIGADLSDHRNYWAAGYPAIMITDTAYLRNPNYHTVHDVPSTLDYDRMAGVLDGVLSGVVRHAK